VKRVDVGGEVLVMSFPEQQNGQVEGLDEIIQKRDQKMMKKKMLQK